MESKLPKSTFFLMLALAGLADVLSFFVSIIPIIGQVLNPIFSFTVALTLWFWLAIKGFGFQGAFGGGASMIIETIPFLQLLPPFTLMVVVIYMRSKVDHVIPVKSPKKMLKRKTSLLAKKAV